MSQGVLYNMIIRYPHLVEPWTSNPSQYEADYNCQFILPADWAGWGEFQAFVKQAVMEKFGANEPVNMKYPWLNKFLQPNVQADGPYQGCYYFNANGKGTKPGIAGPDARPMTDIDAKTQIFSGCIVHAYLGFYGYPSGPGVGVALNGVQLINNQVERIADAGRNVEQMFQPDPNARVGAVSAFQGPSAPAAVAQDPNPFG